MKTVYSGNANPDFVITLHEEEESSEYLMTTI